MDEALPAETGIDAHHEDEVDFLDQVIEHLGRRAGIEHHARLLAERLDRLQRAMDVRPGFRVYGDDVRARFGEGFEIGIDRRDHQMHIERLRCVRAKRFHNCGADGDIGHIMPIHHVDVDPVRPGRIHGTHFFAEPGKIGRQDRGGDQGGGHAHQSMA